jgi:thioester reductase-like protein
MHNLRATLQKWGLWKDGLERRIVAVPGDLSLPRLGIDHAFYAGLCQTIDTIYHCATRMNHLETYTMAKPTNVDSAKELVKLAVLGRPKLINYLSTLSIFKSFDDAANRVATEETSIEGERHTTSCGYIASKWVSEKIFIDANQRGIPCNIFRLGLVWADSQRGRYDELQREYRVFKSSLLSGYGITNYRYELPPTPVDYVARAIVLLANKTRDGGGIFHISSDRQRITDLFQWCNEVAGMSLKLVSYYDWISLMKRLHHEGRSLPVVR